jgi:hypothetical protein
VTCVARGDRRERPLNEVQRPQFRGVRVALGTVVLERLGDVPKRPFELLSRPIRTNLITQLSCAQRRITRVANALGTDQRQIETNGT